MTVGGSRLSGRELDRQKAVTELLTRYRRAEDKKKGGKRTAEDTADLMKKAQAIIGSVTTKRMR